jgi:hypothetical protein
VILPGGFGTLDETFEAVTLIQTKKIRPFPVILVGGDGYWDGLFDWINNTLVRCGKVRPDEVAILRRAKDPQAVLRILKSEGIPPTRPARRRAPVRPRQRRSTR